jgi:hypothetical protein
MALMDKPTDTKPEDSMEATNVVSLDESGDVEQENLEYSRLSQYVSDQFRRSKDHRLQDETRWLSSYRNYTGIC